MTASIINLCRKQFLSFHLNNSYAFSSLLCNNFNSLTPCQNILKTQSSAKVLSESFPLLNYLTVRHLTPHHIDRPSPETCKKNLHYEVTYPKDGKYTISKLPMKKLGGRDPETGRIIFGCIGGGSKRKYRWVQIHRVPPEHLSNTLVEKVLQVQYDPNRTARIALVGQGTQLRYIIATTSMKPGDLITSTKELPRMPIRPKEGDAHPVGALPNGTTVCCIEKLPGAGASIMINAGCNAVITRRVKDKIGVKLPTKQEIALHPYCMVVVGQVSNPDHGKQHIGSPWRLRWLGRRPRSGLWQRKTGRFGRKIKPKPPILHFHEEKAQTPMLYLTAKGQGPSRKIIPATLRVS